ncbi:SAM-dependent methyltransferase [Bosea sp. TWI1241]|uniref:SAM-dependent methyltransferase n=1 Tax=Bosea sp. TWI1241 TaxID=3148904 RepID=UPI003209CFAE
MTGFSAEWLALREPADHAARNPAVLAAVGAAFAGRSSLSIVDLGSGAGSNLRGSYAALPDRQHWTLVDRDKALLEAALATLAQWADDSQRLGEELVLRKEGKTLTVDVRQADLDKDLEWVLGWRPDLVTAAALFDLTSERWIARFAAALASLRLPLYTVLTFDGRESWETPHPADKRMLAAFNHHQRGDKGFGPAAGPDAVELLAQAFRKTGFAVTAGESLWRIDDSRPEFRAALVAGIAAAVRETGQVDEATIAAWAAARQGATGFVGHHDLWARPV